MVINSIDKWGIKVKITASKKESCLNNYTHNNNKY